VHETGKEDQSQRRPVIFEKDADVVMKQTAGAELATDIGRHKDKKGNDYRKVERLLVTEASQYLDALLEIYKGNVKAKDVAGEASYVTEPVAGVGDGENPVHDHGPTNACCQ